MNLAWLLVSVVYVIAVALARRAGADLPKRVAALFFVLVFGFLWRPLTQDVVIVPGDVLKLLPPWSEVRAPNRPPLTKYEVSNLNLHDVPMQIVPWMHQVRESWRRGEIPLWNPSAGCGYPLMANGQSTPFSPFVLLTLPLPLGYAMTAQAALKLLLALVLTYLFCRLRYSPLASVLAAIAYGFSTWMLTWLQFPIATAAAFLPGVLLAIEGLMRGVAAPKFGAAALLFAFCVLSGHPETVFNVGLIAAAHGLWIANLRGLLRVLAASVLAACITAPFLVPFYEAVTRSQRFAEMSAPRDIAPPFSDRMSAALLLQPRFFGELPIERPWGPTTLESICGFAGVLALASIVAAVFIIRRWRSIETLYVLGAVLCFGIVLGWPGITEGFHAIGGLAPPMRMRLGICWFASILIAPVIDHKRREPLLLGALAVAATMFWLMRTTPFPTESHRASALLSLLPSLAVLAAIALAAFRREMLVVAGALTFVELAFAMANWNPILPTRALNPRTPLVAQLERLRGPYRMVGLGGQMYPNVGALWGLEDVRVHDPMAFGRYVDYLAKNVGWNPADYYAKWNDADTPLLARLNVKWIVGEDGSIRENANVRERFFSDAADVKIVRASDDEYQLRIRAKRHALIASSIASYPGWTAGEFRVIDNDGPFIAFMVPPGEHDVTVAYRPRSFSWSLIPSALATAFVLWRMLRARRLR
ncbi:MAG TPA: hypothetical protein VGQ36_26700 [Thermoanaerobaculia bacterium]|nr:hypothetical protein [Thermoanaerobaculia bacterium]